MKILLSGASGFLGSYLQGNLGPELLTLGRGSGNKLQCDLSTDVPNLPQIDMVVHNAGLAHRIPKNVQEEKRFFEVNFVGTQNLLKGLDSMQQAPKSLVFISTVAVYGLNEGELISEKVLPNPETAYAKSKYEAENLLQKWSLANNVNLVILRLPLVAGGKNTPGNLGAMIKAIKQGYYFRVGQGLSRKSIVLAKDLADLIPRLCDFKGIYNLTDGEHPSLRELDNYVSQKFNRKVKSLPLGLLKFIGKIGDAFSFFPINTYRINKLNASLTFDDSKARKTLGWKSKPVIGNLDI